MHPRKFHFFEGIFRTFRRISTNYLITSGNCTLCGPPPSRNKCALEFAYQFRNSIRSSLYNQNWEKVGENKHGLGDNTHSLLCWEIPRLETFQRHVKVVLCYIYRLMQLLLLQLLPTPSRLLASECNDSGTEECYYWWCAIRERQMEFTWHLIAHSQDMSFFVQVEWLESVRFGSVLVRYVSNVRCYGSSEEEKWRDYCTDTYSEWQWDGIWIAHQVQVRRIGLCRLSAFYW